MGGCEAAEPGRGPAPRPGVLHVGGRRLADIDNGGFQYLFESDWPGCPPYGDFAAAYREIGADEVAGWLEEAVALFPFPEPHRQREARVKYLRAHCVKGDSPMGLLSDRAIDASDAVFARLAAYVRNRPDDFRRTWRDWLPRLGGG